MEIDQKAKDRIENLRRKAREKAWKVNKEKKLKRDKDIERQAQATLQQVKTNRNQGRVLAATLYWAEGAKKDSRVSFANSDPEMIELFMHLLMKYFAANRSKFTATLHLHEYHNKAKQIKFWSNITGITPNKIGVYIKPHTGKQKREGYPGCISIRYGDVKLAKQLKFLYKGLTRNLIGDTGE